MFPSITWGFGFDNVLFIFALVCAQETREARPAARLSWDPSLVVNYHTPCWDLHSTADSAAGVMLYSWGGTMASEFGPPQI